MTTAEITNAALTKLEPKEQIDLANKLYRATASPDWHLPIIEDRRERLLANPDACRPVDEVIARVFPELA